MIWVSLSLHPRNKWVKHEKERCLFFEYQRGDRFLGLFFRHTVLEDGRKQGEEETHSEIYLDLAESDDAGTMLF